MKKSSILFLLCFFLLNTDVLCGVCAQPEKAIKLDVRNERLPQVLKRLEKISGCKFLFTYDDLNRFVINKQVNTEDVNSALNVIIEGYPLEYHTQGGYISVALKESPQVPMRQATPSSTVTLQGVVHDSKGSPLPGVSIVVKGEKTGTASALDGSFTLSLRRNEKVVVEFTFIGMETETRTYNCEENILKQVIVMKDNEQLLDEVIVTGLFDYRASSFTGSAVTYSKTELQGLSNQNIIKSLSYLDPSFRLTDDYKNGSNPNAFNNITIRGNSSFVGLQGEYDGDPNAPLFIVDGFEASREQVFDLDMNRVSTVTILKDAAAKAIYGSKAANGVVVIETVEPEKGRLRLSYTGDLNIEAPDLSSYNLANAQEKLQIEWNAGRYTAVSPSHNQALFEQYNNILKNVVEGVDTYWLSKPLHVGVGQKHSLYMEGGDDNMRYSASLAYNGITGVMKGSERNTISGNLKLSYRYKDLLFRNSLTITTNKAIDSPYGSFSEYTSMNPYFKAYDANGNPQKVLGYFLLPSAGSSPLYYYNPLYNATIGTKNFAEYTEYTENFYIEWRALESLRFTGKVGYTFQTNVREDFYPGDHTKFSEWTGDRFFKRGEYAITDGTADNFSADLTANYSNHFGKHMLMANLAWSLNAAKSDKHGMTAWGFLSNRVDHISFARQYAENGRPSGSESATRSIGTTGRVDYSYDDRYLADFTLRINGSSVFGSDNRWGTFWSVGAGWNLSKEECVTNLKFVDLFKLRGSYGYTGSQKFNPYQAKATYKFYEDVVYDNIVGAYLMGMPNGTLKWQQVVDLNVGIDAQLFKSLNIRLDVYRSETKDALLTMTLPTSAGFNGYQENLGSVLNEGFEATLNWRFFRNKQSYASLNGTIGHNSNKLKKINDALKAFNDSQDKLYMTAPVFRYEEGQSMTAIWAVRSLGIDPANGNELFLKKDGVTPTNTWSSEDYVVAGDSEPKYKGTFGLSGEYKGFGINCAFSYMFGGDIYNQTLVNRVENVNIANNVDKRVLHDTWNQVGDIATFKKITSSPKTTYPTTRFVEKNNELQLASLSCYYDFKNQNWLKKASLERLKLSFYMNDLFRISTVKTERGYDYPYARSFSFSLSTTF